ncbi:MULTISPECIES: MucBP domain-containing protein [unclassified Enterococcus]|uniref:MucBP domain-containing protein n=1 Tax=unclassified Enterococcus TaxID=2608891 RepID=UPI001551DD49|nr:MULTISPECIES: MucBP domain-containing protein [unclassified Enterococcus]MBS7576021.1 MucBP domain-containing protein [Enterococcus sp. MMGLQ5-2]MBS7583254.1 MucBP domain-containing protein [Enterococcus sp. MMGLQ5-1]NPD11114.1 LPXTG cell wall anchor domain-containing protein [Enterococcus sp. MMGLQ5-1]NPD35857.1 LPXTG cell wall anchor domain-containing protein [Enterococcus sp. MMGLQ5-2]
MKKRYLSGVLLLLLTIFSVSFLNSIQVSAAEKMTQVTYNFVDFTSLTPEQEKQIVSGNPKEVASTDTIDYWLVYKKVSAQSIESNISTASLKALPKTNEYKSENLYLILGAMFMLSAIGLFIWKRKTIKILLVILIGSTVMGATSVFADVTTIKNAFTEQIVMNTQISHIPELINGYEYVGYISTAADLPVQTGQVTVRYADQGGQPIADDAVLTGTIGTIYTTAVKNFDNYELESIQGSESGTFTRENQVVTYVYAQIGTIKTVIDSSLTANSEGQYSVLNPYYDPEDPDSLSSIWVTPVRYVLDADRTKIIGGQSYRDKVGNLFSFPEEYEEFAAVGFYYIDSKGIERYESNGIFYNGMSAIPTSFLAQEQTITIYLGQPG